MMSTTVTTTKCFKCGIAIDMPYD